MADGLTYYTGTVSKIQKDGFQLKEHGDRWFNRSYYASGRFGPVPPMPPKGAHIIVGIDRVREYARTIKYLDRPDPQPLPKVPYDRRSRPDPAAQTDLHNGFWDTRPIPQFQPAYEISVIPPLAALQPKPAPAEPVTATPVDDRSARMDLLKTATAILTAGDQPVDLYTVINAAATLKAWTDGAVVKGPEAVKAEIEKLDESALEAPKRTPPAFAFRTYDEGRKTFYMVGEYLGYETADDMATAIGIQGSVEEIEKWASAFGWPTGVAKLYDSVTNRPKTDE